MNIIKSPQDDIKAYLYNEVNINIYNFFIDYQHYNELQILEFFNELYREFNFFNENKENYLTIKKHFEYYKNNSHLNVDIDLTTEAYFKNLDIFSGLISLIDFYFIENHNEVILKSCELIKSISDKYNYKETIKKKFDFNFTLKYIKTLPTIKEKIIYLTEIKTDYLQDPQSEIFGASFKEKCELEIQKLKELLNLEKITESNQPQQTEPTPLSLSDTTKNGYGIMEKKIDYLKFITETFFETLYPVESIEQEDEPTEYIVTEVDENDKVISSYTTTTTPSKHPFEIRKDLFIDKIIRKQKTAKKVNCVTISEFSKECNFALKQLYDYVHSIEPNNSIGDSNSIDLKGLNSSLNGSMTSLDICFLEFLITTTFDNLIIKKNRQQQQQQQQQNDTPHLPATAKVIETKVIKEPYGEMFSNNGFELFEYILNEHVKPKETKGRKSDLIYYYWEMYNSNPQYIHQRPAPFFKWFDKEYNETTGQLKTYDNVKTPQRIKDYSTALEWFKSKNK